ncbi:MAG: hypothetical protein IJA10_14985 [Lachnospiraceae bacterium]|nr:hypothetical protein [Lachnospiraceae bacterium]
MRKKTSNKMKQILALVLSAVMVMGTVNASGMTTYAEEASVTEETHSNHGNCGVIGCTDEIHSDNENHSIEAIEWTVLDQKTLDTYIVYDRYYNLPDGNYYLTEDLTLSYWINIVGNVNLCLNGKSITSNMIVVNDADATLNLCDCKENGKITKANGAGVKCHGTFNMYGGNITDNINDYYGGGVYVSNGTFNMYGGSITNNKVTADTGEGGGVRLQNSSNFTMYGGKIANNFSAKYGGGVCVWSGTFTMLGGSIIGNNAPTGAGVYMPYYNDNYLNLSGTPVINNNTGGNLYKDTSAYSGNSGTITIIDELKEGASIGVTWKDNNSNSLTGDFVVAGANYTLTDSDKAKFHSDDSSYAIGLRNNTLALGTSIESATVALNQENYVYNGAPCEPNVTVSLGDKTLNKDTDYTVSYSNNQNAGTATVTINGAGDYVGTITKDFTITQSGSSFGDTLKAYNSEEQESSEFTYGDRITIKAKPQLTGETTENVVTAEDSSSETIPTSGKMALYAGNTQISEIVDAANAVDGVYTMTCDTAEKNLSIGNNTITAKYWDDVNVKDCSQNITVNLKEKELSITKVTAANREYDSSNIVDITEIKLEGIIASDDVSVELTGLNGTLSSANAGTYTSVTLPTLTLTGDDAVKYILVQPTSAVATNVTINPVITVGITEYNKTFGDAEFTLDVTDNNPEADVTYSSSDENVVTVSNGTITIKSAGTATITVSLAESANYKAAENKTITVNVEKAAAPKNKPADTMSASYSCATVGAVTTLPDGWEWAENEKETELTVDTPVTATAKYTGADAESYETTEVQITITRSNCTHTEGKVVCDATVVANDKAPTCTESGLGHTVCTKSDCGEVVRTGITVPSLGHNYKSEVTEPATTSKTGIRTYTCTREGCGDSYTETIPKKSSSSSSSSSSSTTNPPSTEAPSTEEPSTEEPTTGESGTEDSSTETPSTSEDSTIEWKTDEKGTFYEKEDGTRATGWMELGDDNWYYFNEEGYRETSWIKDNGNWYYLSENGVMQTGWVKDNGNWYYLSENGSMQTDWVKVNGDWYYLNENGTMKTGWQKDGEAWYYLGVNGSMQTGWMKDGGIWYFLGESGAMKTGWLKDRTTWYYLNGNGSMKTGWLKDGKTWYYLNESGAMQTGWIQIGKDWFYLNADGSMAADTYIGKWYVDKNGYYIPSRTK